MKRVTVKSVLEELVQSQRRCAAAEAECKRLVSLRQQEADDHESVRNEASRLRLELGRSNREQGRLHKLANEQHQIIMAQAKAIDFLTEDRSTE